MVSTYMRYSFGVVDLLMRLCECPDVVVRLKLGTSDAVIKIRGRRVSTRRQDIEILILAQGGHAVKFQHPTASTKPSTQLRPHSNSRMSASLIARERSPIAVLLNPETDVPLAERDIRVEDWMNDKIQTVADLADFSSLLASVETQKQQLEYQVSSIGNGLNLC